MSTSQIKKATAAFSIFALGIVIGGIPGYSQSDREIPTEHKGLSVTLLGVVGEESLQKQIGLSGYEIRLREIVIEPGGQIARHSHAARPGVVQVISGSWTEGRAAGEGMKPTLTDYYAGKKEALLETWDTEHWGWNTGSEPAHILACDLAPPS